MSLRLVITAVTILLFGYGCFGQGELDDWRSCGQYAQNYSILLADAIGCFARYAQPFSLCERCREKYLGAKTFYEDIQNGVLRNAENQSCVMYLLYSDRIQILEKLDTTMRNIWTKSFCNNCFTNSNQTNTFFIMHQKLYDCYAKYTDMPLQVLPGKIEYALKKQIYHFNHTACTACLPAYSSLNDYFDSIDVDICMDVTDTMNHTRYEWSHMFKCHPKFIRAEDIFVPFVIGFIIVVAFYVGARLKKNTVHVRILKQKRMKLVTADSDDYSHLSQ